jgi:hypothetical protein
MKPVSTMAAVAVGLLSLAPTLRAQEPADAARDAAGRIPQAPGPCSAWTVRAMRGTYAFTATAWSKTYRLTERAEADVEAIAAFTEGACLAR